MSGEGEAKLSRKRRTLWICGGVLFSLLVLAMTIGCGRKKPPMSLDQNTARLVVGWQT